MCGWLSQQPGTRVELGASARPCGLPNVQAGSPNATCCLGRGGDRRGRCRVHNSRHGGGGHRGGRSIRRGERSRGCRRAGGGCGVFIPVRHDRAQRAGTGELRFDPGQAGGDQRGAGRHAQVLAGGEELSQILQGVLAIGGTLERQAHGGVPLAVAPDKLPHRTQRHKYTLPSPSPWYTIRV